MNKNKAYIREFYNKIGVLFKKRSHYTYAPVRLCVRREYALEIQIRNMKMVFNIYGTWR